MSIKTNLIIETLKKFGHVSINFDPAVGFRRVIINKQGNTFNVHALGSKAVNASILEIEVFINNHRIYINSWSK